MTLSIRWKVTFAALFALVCGFVIAGLLAARSIEQQELARSNERLDVLTNLVAFELQPALFAAPSFPNTHALQALVKTLSQRALARITLVSTEGLVLADSAVEDQELPALDNHRNRPEIDQALRTGTGTDLRASHTTGEKTFYRAIRFTSSQPADRTILIRLGLPLRTLDQELTKLKFDLALAFGTAFLIAVALSIWLARSLTKPLSDMAQAARRHASGDHAAHITTSSRDEVGLLGDALNHMITELRRLEKIRKDFVANVSHELRTPLTSIKGYVEALLDGGKDDPAMTAQFLDVILKQSDRLNLILEDLLQLSKIESGQVLFKQEPLHLGSLIERTIATLKPLADKKGHTLTTRIASSLPLIVGDEDRLVQVLTNLIDNAVKYTPEHGRITVEAQLVQTTPAASSHEHQMVELVVTDSGIGVPEQDRPRVFERFYRVDKARSRELGGTGLGLAIVKHIVEGHGGQVWVEANRPTGSRFVVRLPVQQPEAVRV